MILTTCPGPARILIERGFAELAEQPEQPEQSEQAEQDQQQKPPARPAPRGNSWACLTGCGAKTARRSLRAAGSPSTNRTWAPGSRIGNHPRRSGRIPCGFACIGLISRDMGKLPITVGAMRDGVRQVTPSPVDKLLAQPNPTKTPSSSSNTGSPASCAGAMPTSSSCATCLATCTGCTC